MSHTWLNSTSASIMQTNTKNHSGSTVTLDTCTADPSVQLRILLWGQNSLVPSEFVHLHRRKTYTWAGLTPRKSRFILEPVSLTLLGEKRRIASIIAWLFHLSGLLLVFHKEMPHQSVMGWKHTKRSCPALCHCLKVGYALLWVWVPKKKITSLARPGPSAMYT